MSVLETIKLLKEKQFGSFSLRGYLQSKPFSLVFVTRDCVGKRDIISLFSQWRKRHEFWFQAQFPIDDERTSVWLQKRVLDVPDRVLFLIEIEGRYVGHVGLFRYDENTRSIDIDNIVRGEEGNKGIMQEALLLLMGWGRKELGVGTFTLQTTSDNEKALALYQRLGFTETKRIPLTYRRTEDGGEWFESDGHDGKIGRYEVFMIRDDR